MSNPSDIRTMSQLPLVLTDLNTKGWSIIHVLTEAEYITLRNGFYTWLESLGTGIDRSDPTTWTNKNWPYNLHGIIQQYSIGHSQLVWDARCNANIIEVFAFLWGTEELLTSFDGACFMRPPEYNRNWGKESKSWPHIDQHPTEPGRQSIQGALNLYDSGLEDGGLVVYSGSMENHSNWDPTQKWVKPDPSSPVLSRYERIKVCAPAGTLFLWDSRTVHCNQPPSPTRNSVDPIPRMVIYICMTPASMCTPSELEKKRQAFWNGDTTSHWPHKVVLFSKRPPKQIAQKDPVSKVGKAFGFVRPVLSERGKQLAGLVPYDSSSIADTGNVSDVTPSNSRVEQRSMCKVRRVREWALEVGTKEMRRPSRFGEEDFPLLGTNNEARRREPSG